MLMMSTMSIDMMKTRGMILFLKTMVPNDGSSTSNARDGDVDDGGDRNRGSMKRGRGRGCAPEEEQWTWEVLRDLETNNAREWLMAFDNDTAGLTAPVLNKIEGLGDPISEVI